MRNSGFLLFCVWLLAACGGSSETNTETHAPIIQASAPASAGNVDLAKSVIRWKGTKLMKSGHHEGTLRLSEGSLQLKDGLLAGGTFVADMNSIEVTDIPEHEPVPRRNLVNHLKSEFSSERFPYSRFDITSVEHAQALQKICGTLQIKGIAKEVCFEASWQEGYWQGNLTLRRSDWNIGEEGSWLEKRLVDDEFYLEVVLWID